MRKLLILLCLSTFFIADPTLAQKLPNTLLWRISGNGLQKPSYLFGTMHLTDERLFDLGDSLYSAIENTSGFATEVNPEEMSAYLIGEIKKELKNEVRIKEIMNDKEFKKYSTSLSRKLKIPADDITTRDIFKEKNKWITESYKKGKMATFLDGYLYDVARRLGKWTGGIEDIDDQMGLLDNLIDESDIKQIAMDDKENAAIRESEFIKIYIRNDLNAIDSIINLNDSSYRDALLIKRNIKMARRIDSLGKFRSMVFAVGAAHLPGRDGLIQLLKNKGFQVEPVLSSKRIKPENYKIKEIELPWVDIEEVNGLYKTKMPGQPATLEMYGILEMKMYYDISNSSAYLTAAMNTPYDKKTMDSLVRVMTKNVFKTNDLSKTKPISINQINGGELEKEDEEGYKHGYIMQKDNIMYIAVGFSIKRNDETEKALNKFLSSFQVFDIKKKNDSHSFVYIDPIQAYKLELPAKPQSANDLIAGIGDGTIKRNIMTCNDQQTGAYFLFGSNAAAPGFYIINDSTTLESIKADVKSKCESVTLDTMYVQNGYRVLDCKGIMAQSAVTMRSRHKFRGNRWYALIAIYDDTKENPSVEAFFNSFEYLDYPITEWKQQTSDDRLFTTWAPSSMRYKTVADSITRKEYGEYEAYDSIHADSYFIIAENFSKYYWQESDSIFWQKIINGLIAYNDTLISKEPVKNGDVSGYEIVMGEKGSSNVKRRRMFLYGDSLYSLSTAQPWKTFNNSNSLRFFNDFKFNKTAPLQTLFISKAKLLLEDLASNDSVISSQATDALISASFSLKELPLLHNALLKTYFHGKDDFLTVNERLANHIIDLKDSSSLIFAKNNYLTIGDKAIKNILLRIISEYKTKENYNEMKDLILKFPPSEKQSYGFTSNLKDSLQLTAIIIPGLLPLLNDTVMASSLIEIIPQLVDSNLLSFTLLKPYQQNILKYAQQRFKRLQQNGDDYNMADISLIKLLGKYKTAECYTMLQKWLTLKPAYLRFDCVEELLKGKQTVSNPVLHKLAEDKYYRIDLYKTLKKQNKQNLFPKEYLSQQSFAQSMAYVTASDEDEPSDLIYITQKTLSFNGKKARFFFFKITYGDEDDPSYSLACAGPFDLDMTKLCEEDASGELYYEEDFNPSKLEDQIKELVKTMEEWYKNKMKK
jgi:uncharacterized protein YbaP (TraB family)